MTETRSTVPLPYQRDSSHPFDPDPEIGRLRAREPVRRIQLPSEVSVWFVTRYAEARQVLGDTRFSSAKTPTWLVRLPMVKGSKESAPPEPGALIGFDPPEHTRLRRILAGQFTVKRMNLLRPRVEQIVTDHLETMEHADKPVDLVEAFCFPVPALVICELLGVPYEDRDEFKQRSKVMLDLSLPHDTIRGAYEGMRSYLSMLVAAQREQPGDGMLGMLVREHGEELSDAELAGIGRILLFAGHETTASMLALGTLLLLQHPEQAARLRDDPASVGSAVEEMLRYLSIVQAAVIRTASEDLSIGDQPVKAGDYVMVSLPAANRDETVCDDPERFDIGRRPSAHIAFGHGVHHCLGAPLARMELETAIPALMQHFPNLRTAVPIQDIAFRTMTIFYGVPALPVTW